MVLAAGGTFDVAGLAANRQKCAAKCIDGNRRFRQFSLYYPTADGWDDAACVCKPGKRVMERASIERSWKWENIHFVM